jgi:hypothetical protein
MLVLYFIPIDLLAQVDKLSKERFEKEVKEQDSILALNQKVRDSLRKEFYKSPPIIDLSFELNKQKISLFNNFEFWIENNKQRYFPKTIDANKFLLDSISDTIVVTFKYKTDTLRFPNISYRYIRNGAEFRFGIIENLKEIRRTFKKLKRDYEFNKYTDFGQPYLRIVEDKKIKKQQRKIGNIDFLVIQPRVYGDGTILENVTIKPKKK